mmetsp:Transcript_16134/g.41462  ORF Transcript_16134/g.41462 Transcript_16134/m.41462 type:complete len:106 (-) Transcript_16134:816-1133(-)
MGRKDATAAAAQGAAGGGVRGEDGGVRGSEAAGEKGAAGMLEAGGGGVGMAGAEGLAGAGVSSAGEKSEGDATGMAVKNAERKAATLSGSLLKDRSDARPGSDVP